MKIIAAAAAGLAVVALIFAGLAWSHLSGVETSARNAQQASRSASSQISQLQNQVATLQGKVAGLNVPTDPLAAYTDICNQPFTNGTTGVSQTYYFPCTNSAQTIPQPGT
jgi:tRNA1(Val) A37 N6-methylase TrmN6